MKESIFEKIAEKLLCFPFAQRIYSEKVKKQLRILHPSGEPDVLCKNYYKRKLGLMLKILCVGISLLILMVVSEKTNVLLKEDNSLPRAAIGESSNQIVLEIQSEEKGTINISYEVAAQLYTPEEIEQQIKRFSRECENLIRGENGSLQEVYTHLFLRTTYETYPMEIEWESSDYALINDDGTVHNEELVEKQMVELTANMTYEEIKYEHTFTVCVLPPRLTAAQQWQKEISEAIRESDKKQRYSPRFLLPEAIGETAVQYAIAESEEWKIWFVFLPAVLILIYQAKDRDLSKETELQKKRMSLKYPEFVSKFQLLLGAGMSARNVFIRLKEDNALGEELSEQLEMMLRDIKNGISLKEAMDRFGKRTANPLYIKFSALLIQNMKKGTEDLLEQLSKEASEAFILRKQHARQLGEEAGTKLLGPMILMLVVVMAVLIVPAFLSFQL